ncbi:alpha/beta hydrolase [Candidatus Sumerlaeota bacterium]|nr:alpha/beta hydrolase [Candidatus Sumerlaeota bacterium]
MKRIAVLAAMIVGMVGLNSNAEEKMDIEQRVEHGYADSNGVKIHYASLGKGPLIIMIHGFPDFWYSWRHQMEALADEYQCVAVDQRGYNLSDKPQGQENYDMKFLVGDIAAVVRHLGKEKAIICGHDWGGMVAWSFAMTHPEMTEKLIILNLPHPKGLARELATNPKQYKASEYARNFQKPDAASKVKPEGLAFWVTDPAAREKYIEAFKRSDIEAMLNYYKQNYPKTPPPGEATAAPASAADTSVPASGSAPASPSQADIIAAMPKIQMPVLMFHGLKDFALLSPALNGTWDWVDKDLTLVTIPNAGHFVQQDAADLVSRSMRMWLDRDK